MDIQSELDATFKHKFRDLLVHDFDDGNSSTVYGDRLKQLLRTAADKGVSGTKRLLVDLDHVRIFDRELYQQILRHPIDCLPAFQDTLFEHLRTNNDPELQKLLSASDRLDVGFTGAFGWNRVSPRDLLSPLISQLVQVFGIVTKCSTVRPKVVRSAHFCEKTKAFQFQEYRDVASHRGPPTGTRYPTRDESNNLLTTEFGLCQYQDHQVITIQELPETAPAGQMPRSAEIILEDDLVDTCKPGDRLAVTGVYKAVPPRAQGAMSGVFRAVIVATNVVKLDHEQQLAELSEAEYREMKKIAAQPDALDHLAQSLAPSIYGMDTVKKALILVLLGGQERNLDNGTHIRGDINCLLVGDPGVAKSQLLRAMMKVAPLAVSTTGRGSSGVGLTAAVTTDADTGEKRLEAGAMVLADRGLVVVDEFDKMSDLDRVAIHEAMEQQTVTIAKAGIHVSLNARCSVVAAANPIYGTYDPNLSPPRNINLPDSLLSRFDVLFVLQDHIADQRDRSVASYVLGQHRWRRTAEDGTTSADFFDMLDQEEEREEVLDDDSDAIYCRYDVRLYGARGAGRRVPLTIPFLRKYLQYCKLKFASLRISDEAQQAVKDLYAELRDNSQQAGNQKALPVTARTLETIIRLASAHAKLRFSRQLEAADVAVAAQLLDHVLGDADATQLPAEPEARAGPATDPENLQHAANSTAQRRESNGGEAAAAGGRKRGRTAPDVDADAGAARASRGRKAAGRSVRDAVVTALRQLLQDESVLEVPLADLLQKVQGSADGEEVLGVLKQLTDEDQHGMYFDESQQRVYRL